MIRVAYDKRQTAKRNDSYSPSATKPEKVMRAWKKSGIPFQVLPITPASVEDLSRVHRKSMVTDILSLKKLNGFGNRMPEVAEALPWVSGSMVAAGLEAKGRGGVVFSPTSGAHHAGYDFTGGFCTFNFLALTALKVHQTFNCSVGILDCDAHYGNGTDDIIQNKGWYWVEHHSMGRTSLRHKAYLKGLKKALNKMDVGLLIYNAGADPHENDPLGGMLSTEELFERDRMVFRHCRKHNIPVAVSLAGGYQSDIKAVIEIHCNTLKAAHEIYGL